MIETQIPHREHILTIDINLRSQFTKPPTESKKRQKRGREWKNEKADKTEGVQKRRKISETHYKILKINVDLFLKASVYLQPKNESDIKEVLKSLNVWQRENEMEGGVTHHRRLFSRQMGGGGHSSRHSSSVVSWRCRKGRAATASSSVRRAAKVIF